MARRGAPRGAPPSRCNASPVGYVCAAVERYPGAVGIRCCLSRRPCGPAIILSPVGGVSCRMAT